MSKENNSNEIITNSWITPDSIKFDINNREHLEALKMFASGMLDYLDTNGKPVGDFVIGSLCSDRMIKTDVVASKIKPRFYGLVLDFPILFEVR